MQIFQNLSDQICSTSLLLCRTWVILAVQSHDFLERVSISSTIKNRKSSILNSFLKFVHFKRIDFYKIHFVFNSFSFIFLFVLNFNDIKFQIVFKSWLISRYWIYKSQNFPDMWNLSKWVQSHKFADALLKMILTLWIFASHWKKFQNGWLLIFAIFIFYFISSDRLVLELFLD